MKRKGKKIKYGFGGVALSFLLIIVLLSDIKEAFALNQADYDKNTGERLTLTDWNRLDEDFTAQDPALSDLNMGNNRIINVASPVNDSDAANRQYLNSLISSIIMANAAGAIRDDSGNPLGITCGITGVADWQLYSGIYLYTYVDTSSANFSSTPYYFTSLVEGTDGPIDVSLFEGSSSIYTPTPDGFYVYIYYPSAVTVAQAQAQGLRINWCGAGY